MARENQKGWHTRRKLLTAAGAAISASFAGCTGTLEESDSDADVAFPPQSVSNGEWVGVDKSTQKLDYPGLKGHAGVRIYENPDLQADIKRRFAGQFKRPLALGFAARIEYSGITSTGVTSGGIYDNVEPTFKSKLKEEGLSEIGKLTKKMWKEDSRPDPPRKTLRNEEYGEFLAKYTVKEQTSRMDLDGFGEQEFEFPQKVLPMRALLFVTDLSGVGTTGSGIVLGGAYPQKNYGNEASSTLAENDGASISATISLDSGIDIKALRKSLISEFIAPVLKEMENE